MVHNVNGFCVDSLKKKDGGQMIALVTKSTRFNLRVTEEFQADIKALAAFYGITPSSMAHSLLVRAMREEKSKTPEAFLVPRSGARSTTVKFGNNEQGKLRKTK